MQACHSLLLDAVAGTFGKVFLAERLKENGSQDSESAQKVGISSLLKASCVGGGEANPLREQNSRDRPAGDDQPFLCCSTSG